MRDSEMTVGGGEVEALVEVEAMLGEVLGTGKVLPDDAAAVVVMARRTVEAVRVEMMRHAVRAA